MSTFLSFFNRQAPHPIPIASTVPTQIFVTLDRTTHVDPPTKIPPPKRKGVSRMRKQPSFPSLRKPPSLPSLRKQPSVPSLRKQQPSLPVTPNAPQADRTTFELPMRPESLAAKYQDHDGESDCDGKPSEWYQDDDSECEDEEVHSSVYIVSEPRTLARTVFLFGFLFPPFWIAGLAIMLMPLRPTPAWSFGKTPSEIAYGVTVARATELRWARRCLIAFVIEATAIVLIIVTVRWSMQAHTK